MKIGDTKVKPYRDSDGYWYIVSDIYEPPSRGKVGSGIIWATPYKTKKDCQKAIRESRDSNSNIAAIHTLLAYVSNRIATGGNPKNSEDACVLSRTEARELQDKIGEARTLIRGFATKLSRKS